MFQALFCEVKAHNFGARGSHPRIVARLDLNAPCKTSNSQIDLARATPLLTDLETVRRQS